MYEYAPPHLRIQAGGFGQLSVGVDVSDRTCFMPDGDVTTAYTAIAIAAKVAPTPSLPPTTNVCPACGTLLDLVIKPGRRRIYCSVSCREQSTRNRESAIRRAERAAALTPCLRCGADILLGALQGPMPRYCSAHCSAVARGVKMPEPLGERVCLLPECGATFRPMRDSQNCCCEKHGKKYCSQRRRAAGLDKLPWDDKRKAAWHKRRALQKGAEVGAPVILAVIAKRDRYKCGICGQRVDMSVKWPLPMHPSIDHIVPLSRGGEHSPANCQLAHGRCNAGKGNRGAEQQLALI